MPSWVNSVHCICHCAIRQKLIVSYEERTDVDSYEACLMALKGL